jgi:hypothetical protein
MLKTSYCRYTPENSVAVSDIYFFHAAIFPIEFILDL